MGFPHRIVEGDGRHSVWWEKASTDTKTRIRIRRLYISRGYDASTRPRVLSSHGQSRVSTGLTARRTCRRSARSLIATPSDGKAEMRGFHGAEVHPAEAPISHITPPTMDMTRVPQQPRKVTVRHPQHTIAFFDHTCKPLACSDPPLPRYLQAAISPELAILLILSSPPKT
jgi:hypothetical protein